MKIEERPKCEKPGCEEYAIVLWGDMWLCGNHLVELQEKLNKERRDMLIHG